MTLRFERGVILPGAGQAQVVDAHGVRSIPFREATGLDCFAERLSHYLAIPVFVVEGTYTPSASDLVLCHAGSVLDFLQIAPDARHRCVAFAVSDPLAKAVRYGVAAVIGLRSYNLWRIDYRRFAPTVVGLRKVTPFAPTLVSVEDEEGDYVSFGGPDTMKLPELLACYLEAYQRCLRGPG